MDVECKEIKKEGAIVMNKINDRYICGLRGALSYRDLRPVDAGTG